MNISRQLIITTLQSHLEADPNVLAAWLEGADATGIVDAYSDIDLVCSVTAGTMQLVMERARVALECLGRLDICQISPMADDFLSASFHLEGTSPYLLVDFDVFLGRGSQFTEGDQIEKPLILFDRAGVVCFLPPAEHLAYYNQPERLKTLVETVSQQARIEKYILRGEFIEAVGYYHQWLLTPLVEVLRMRYTPLHPDYFIVHISRHLPEHALRRLGELYKVGSLEELAARIKEARLFFEETVAVLTG